MQNVIEIANLVKVYPKQGKNEVDPAASSGVSGQRTFQRSCRLGGAFRFRPSSSGQAPRYSAGHNKALQKVESFLLWKLRLTPTERE